MATDNKAERLSNVLSHHIMFLCAMAEWDTTTPETRKLVRKQIEKLRGQLKEPR